MVSPRPRNGLVVGPPPQGPRAHRQRGSGAAVAAAAVGHESASQFSRGFKRFFDESPAEEAKCARAFIAEPAVADARAVS
jgi:AraC-like DNA-binding protein